LRVALLIDIRRLQNDAGSGESGDTTVWGACGLGGLLDGTSGLKRLSGGAQEEGDGSERDGGVGGADVGDERIDEFRLVEAVFDARRSEPVGVEEGGCDFCSAGMDHSVSARPGELGQLS